MAHQSRRVFLKRSSVTAAGLSLALQYPSAKVLGANERIRVGFIGVGNRGTQLLQGFLKQADAEVVALCDVYEPYLQRDYSKVDAGLRKALGGRVPPMDEKLPDGVRRYRDFRRLLEQKDIDAVVIATPDHWHALQTVMACQAEKDVYVEKPLSVTIREGRRMVEAADTYKRVVQVGLHRRSSPLYAKLAEAVQGGKIGKVTVARAYRISNMFPDGIGKSQPSPPPEGMDWDMWLGPRPKRPYQDNIALYKFRWWTQYSSQMANWGIHYFDAIRWLLNETAPVSLSAFGGRYAVEDDRTVPDTAEAVFELPSGVLLNFGQYEANGGEALAAGEIELRGVRGNLYANESSYEIQPSRPGQFQSSASPLKPESEDAQTGNQSLTEMHIRNFLDCVKSRKRCHCDMETGHRSTTFALLANISLATGTRLHWDSNAEKITNHPEINEMLHYAYRSPWKLE